jgi:hypothetical protein
MVAMPITCASIEQTGCRAHDSDCKSTTSNGCTADVTFDITFAQDGSSASGLETAVISCPNGQTCASTYQVTSTRQ